MISHTKAGRIAEFFACGIIEELGWQTSLCQQDGVDLIAFKNNEFIRVQVKGSRIKTEPKKNTSLQFILGLGGNKRLPTNADYDIACLVSTQQRKCWFAHVSELQQLTIRRSVMLYNSPNLEMDSWETSLDIFRESMKNAKHLF